MGSPCVIPRGGLCSREPCAAEVSLLCACAGPRGLPAAPASAAPPRGPPEEGTPVSWLAWEVWMVASGRAAAMAPVQRLPAETSEMDWASNPLVSTWCAAEQKYHA